MNDQKSGIDGQMYAVSAHPCSTDNLQDDFISCVAHELRTPVAILRGSLEALCDGAVTDKQQTDEYYRQMLSESIYLQRLVSDLLDFSRLRNTEFSIAMEPVCVTDVLDDVYRGFRHIADQKGISIEKKYDSGTYVINGDYGRLRQMFAAVADNAVKFTPYGGNVQVKLSQSGDSFMVHISDTGCGIAENEISDIFTKFHRRMSDDNSSGTGLGLAITNSIASRHCVSINVKSSPGCGTDFCFDFSKAQRIDV
ncbi:MAG: HAMP domain-containing sensor histidine kinase [Oscillospiraceae bacterium]|nr:HAMP domain-containing sensor histidine kinase [Oscillospiraceae bacterium]